MKSSEFDPSLFRNISHTVQIPDIKDIKISTYAQLIESIINILPDQFGISLVEKELKKTYGFTELSSILIEKALLSISRLKYKKDFDGIFKKSDFTIIKIKEKNPYETIIDKLVVKISREIGKLDHQQILLIESLVKVSIIELAEVSDDLVRSFLEKHEFYITQPIIEKIEKNWKEEISGLDRSFIEKFDKIIKQSIISLKGLFSNKDEISEILGMISLTLVFRSFILADPELLKLERELFSKTKIVLDTNIIIAYLCQGCLENYEIKLLLENCHRIGIRLVLTDKTVKEFERTVLKDNIKHSLQKAAGKSDLNFASRDIPMGYYLKWSKIGSWNKYMKYLEGGISILKSNLNIEVKSDLKVKDDDFIIGKKRVKESLRDKYKEEQAINHDVFLIFTGHEIREEIKDAVFPSFILTREAKLSFAERKLIRSDGILQTPQMIKTPDVLLELLLPFFVRTTEKKVLYRVSGKIFSNIVINIDKKLFEYFAEYISIEGDIGTAGSEKLMSIVLDDYISDNLVLQSEKLSHEEFTEKYIDTINAGIIKLDRSEELSSKLTKLVKLAKVPPPTAVITPKIQNSFIGRLLQIFEGKLPIFCDPKPKNEKEFQKEIYKLLRASDYLPNKDKDQLAFSLKGSKPDFTFQKEKIAIEAKYIGEKTEVTEIIEQMAADITLYSKHYDIIIFIIYDLKSKINDIEAFKKDFEENGHPTIIIK